jgi:hypothetical protein
MLLFFIKDLLVTKKEVRLTATASFLRPQIGGGYTGTIRYRTTFRPV